MSLHTGIEPSKEIDLSVLNIPTKKYVDDADNLRLAKSGGTLTGWLSMDNNKITDLGTLTTNTHASTKKYVDDQAALKLDVGGGQMTGPLSLGNGRLWDVADPTLDTNGANKKYVDDKHALTLLKSGGTMSGELSMDDNKITDLATPTDNTDAANKKYVDDQIPSTPNSSHYFAFEFTSVRNNVSIQARNLTGYMFWTNDRDIKLTILAHVFDDDNALSNLNLYYKVEYWTKAKVKKQNTTIWKTNLNEYVSITGSSLQTFGIFKSITIKDISCFTLHYKYFHTVNLENESAVHCLIEYV